MGKDAIVYKINIEYSIKIEVANKYHMIRNGWNNRCIPLDILNASLIYDKRVMNDSVCLDRILNLDGIKYYGDFKEKISKRLSELQNNENNINY